jgi:fructose-bisphosphate aldolase class I
VPLLKVDRGLADEVDGAQRMKRIDGHNLLEKAIGNGIFGTKMRSLVTSPNQPGISSVLAQQFAYAEPIAAAGLVPILEPEVGIDIPDKPEAEAMLLESLHERLDALPEEVTVMLKLTLPSVDGLHRPLLDHPRVLRVLALSGGYSRERACALLARNPGVIASFSRAFTEGLSYQLTAEEFDAQLDTNITAIYAASI